jgi:hypothetical protein
MRPRTFVQVNDDLLLIEIIRRLRHQPISGVDYIAYPGVYTSDIIAAALPLFRSEKALRATMQELLDDGGLICYGRSGQMFSPEELTPRTESGLVKWLHPDGKLMGRTWYTPMGTPLNDQQKEVKRRKKEHAFYIGMKFWYVTTDGLPKSVQNDVRRNRIIFDRNIQPWTVA